MNQKRIVIVISIILSIIIISLGIVKLYQTYALSNYIGSTTDTGIDVYVNDDSYVSISANSSSSVYYMLTNTNPGTVKYGVAYETTSGITVKVYSTSKDLPSGTIEENERKYIRLRIKNTNSTSETIKLSTILGYENGGDLIIPSGVTMITDAYTPKPLAADTITNLYINASKTTIINNDITYNIAKSVSLMNDRLGGTTAGLDGGNIRYYGAKPNNYIYFNCDDYSNQSSSTCEVWRIIGVFNGKLKIRRTDSIGSLAWDQDKNEDSTKKTYDNDWTTATLQKLLNESYYNGTGTITYYSGSTGTTSNSLDMTSIGLKNNATRSMISKTTWNLGGWNSNTIFTNQIYAYERGTTVYSGRSTTWTGNIGLIYPSDYGYAADLSSCTQNLYNYDNTSCKNSDWMYNGVIQWTITQNSDRSYGTWGISSTNRINSLSNVYAAYGVHPVVFLDSDLAIEVGDGTSSNPYQLSEN